MIKKYVCFLSFLTLLCFMGCTGCSSDKEDDSVESPNALVPSIMVNDVIYYTTGKEVIIDIEEDEYMGRISSIIPIKELPSKNGQANIPFKNAPYAVYQDGIIILMDNAWILFKTR